MINDISHAFLSPTVAKLSTLNQTQSGFLANPVYT